MWIFVMKRMFMNIFENIQKTDDSYQVERASPPATDERDEAPLLINNPWHPR